LPEGDGMDMETVREMELRDQVAVVTGGGSGIGRATALRLASEGVRLVLVDLSREHAEEAAGQIRNVGGQATALEGDVSLPEAVRRMIETALEAYNGFDILHNNAGIGGGPPPFPAGDPARWRRVIDVNFGAVVTGCQLGIQTMRERGGQGVIVNTASMGGFGPMPQNPTYAATKAAVIAFTRSLAGALEGTQIRVNCVCPGYVDTPMLRRNETEESRRRLASLPMLEAGEVASAVLRLIRDDSINLKALQIGVNRPETLV
jgi:NAD(P)-dependent dehydrogenase (short-subunit alcohol dehydrogenase family)